MIQLSGDKVRHGLRTRTFGQNVVYIKQIGSTNTELKRLARQGAPEGLLYFTDEQLVGRGRLSRSWFAPAYSSLLASLLFYPGSLLAPTQIQELTMICALAMAVAIETNTGISPGLKWPNDLLGQDGKKLGGLLTESEFEGDRLNWVIVGLGLNVNVDFNQQAFSEPDRSGQSDSRSQPLAQIATSLSMILGEDTGHLRLPILQRYLENVERRYEALSQGYSPHEEWTRRLVGMGQSVTVTVLGENEKYVGKIVGVDKNGALRLQQSDGNVMTILAGDVTLK